MHYMKNNNVCSGATGAVYGLGFVGSLFYFVSQAVGFWAVILAILKSFAWPGMLVFHLLKFLNV